MDGKNRDDALAQLFARTKGGKETEREREKRKTRPNFLPRQQSPDPVPPPLDVAHRTQHHALTALASLAVHQGDKQTRHPPLTLPATRLRARSPSHSRHGASRSHSARSHAPLTVSRHTEACALDASRFPSSLPRSLYCRHTNIASSPYARFTSNSENSGYHRIPGIVLIGLRVLRRVNCRIRVLFCRSLTEGTRLRNKGCRTIFLRDTFDIVYRDYACWRHLSEMQFKQRIGWSKFNILSIKSSLSSIVPIIPPLDVGNGMLNRYDNAVFLRLILHKIFQ